MTERQEEQAALHALHLLDAHEERILQSETRNDAKLASLIPELEDAAGLIALALPPEPPPPECRRMLLTELKQRRRANVVNFTKPFRVLGNVWLGWAAALTLLFVAWHYRREKHRLQDDSLAQRDEAVAARHEVEGIKGKLEAVTKELASARLDATEQAEKVAQLQKVHALSRMEAASLRAVIKRFDEAVAVVIWDAEKQEGKLRFEKMPPTAVNKDYQLWVIDKATKAPVSAGVVKLDPRGSATLTFKPVAPVAEIAKFAVSIENLGGVEKKSADGPIILASP